MNAVELGEDMELVVEVVDRMGQDKMKMIVRGAGEMVDVLK